MKKYLWSNRVNREGIYIVDEVLGAEERKKRWDDREKESLERIEKEERRREMRERED